MKVLHILYSGLGGHGNVFFSMLQADKKREFEYEVLFNGVEPLREEYERKCDAEGIAWTYVKKKPGLDIKFYVKICSFIRKKQPDVVFLHGSGTTLPVKIASLGSRKIKKIVVRETQANHLKTRKEWGLLVISMLLAGKIVFLSNAYDAEIRKKLRGFYRKKKTSIIPNGINLDIYHPGETRNTGHTVLGMQSRLVPIKDHLTLLQAVALLEQYSRPEKFLLKIAGDGEFRKCLEEETKKLKISHLVEFTGTLDETALVDFIQSTDIYIHASLGETMSTAIMQAMACRKPIIASDVQGISNMISHNETGILVAPKNVKDMADAISDLINNPEKARELALNAYRYATDNYSNVTMFNKYKQLFIS